MKTLATIAIGILCLGVSLLCLGHMGQLVPMLPQAWFLLFVGASACASYAFLGVFLIWYAVQESRAKKTRENKHREQRRYATTTTGYHSERYLCQARPQLPCNARVGHQAEP